MSRARAGRRTALLAPLLLAAALVAGCTSAGTDDATTATATVGEATRPCPEQPDTPAAGTPLLPDLSFDCLGGGRLDLGRAPGVPTVLNLWGSWCGPCREELPLVQQLADAAGPALEVVGVVSRDGRPQAASFAADAGVTVPAAFDGEGRLMSEMGFNSLPRTFFLNPDGSLAYTQVGPVTSLAEFEQLVAAHLGVQL